MNQLSIAILTGPTASGKSQIALEFASQNDSIEIVNADSLLVYKGINIGTAKPSTAELQKVPHHLINIRNLDEPFTAGIFRRAAEAAIADIHTRGKRALVVGGTGFYLKSLLFGLWDAPPSSPSIKEKLNKHPPEELHERLLQVDPESAKRIGFKDRYRLIRALELLELTGKTPTTLQLLIPSQPDPRFLLLIVDRDQQDLFQRIQARTAQMIQDGIIQEVETIQKEFPNCRPLSSVGYAQVCHHLTQVLPQGRKIKPGLQGLSEEIQLATRQLVKSQRTWFKNQLQIQPIGDYPRVFQLDRDRPLLEKILRFIYRKEH